MCPTRLREEAVEAPRCAIWWHLCILFGLVGSGLGILGVGWLYNANLGRNSEKRIEVMEYQLLERTKTLDAIQGDVKELLRRSGRVGTGDKG
jgi:hypothetical protein